MSADDPTKTALLHSLTVQREHVLGALEGLDAAALRQPMFASRWTCLGLVQHLALDVERFWFPMVMAGQSPEDDWTPAARSAWSVHPDVAPEAVLGLYRQEIQRADRFIHQTRLDDAPTAWPEDVFGTFRLPDLRAVILHVITETACHAGHLDAARELLDGRTWSVLD